MDYSDLAQASNTVNPLPASAWDGAHPRSRALTPLYLDHYCGPRGRPPYTQHPFWEITYVLSGSGSLECERETLALGPGTGVLIPPRCRHRERSQHPAWDTLYVAFLGRAAAALPAVGPLFLAEGRALMPGAELLLQWRQGQVGAIGAELDALTAYFVQSFVRLSRQTPGAPLQTWLPRVLEYVHAHLAEPLQMADLARVAGTSVGHFQRRFRAATGETPLHYLTRQRLQRARQYLRQSDLPVKAIAYRAGFVDPLYFSRVFKQATGQSPSAWRRAATDAGTPP